MLRRNLAFIMALIAVPMSIHATDLQQTVAGDDETENSLENSKATPDSTYVTGGDMTETVDSVKDTKGVDYIFDHGVKEVSDSKVTPKKQFEDFGYTAPGTFEKQENYIDLDKKKYTKDFRKYSSGGINLAFIKNDYDYQSTNDIINRTIGSGYKSVKGGSLHIRNDSFFVHTDYLNLHWSVGGGVGYNSGKGIFASTGQQSDATFSLWEIPVDAGLGLEIPVAHWFKIAGTGGGSVMTLIQNRSDFQRGEKGKRKIQFSPGYFANAQFKINLTGFSEEAAYEMFTSSEITNLFMNLEIRHENYASFKDDIKISGTSFGIGFTFEYL